jgi:hypothetical protein
MYLLAMLSLSLKSVRCSWDHLVCSFTLRRIWTYLRTRRLHLFFAHGWIPYVLIYGWIAVYGRPQ